MIAFLDSSALIYLTEGAEPFAARVRAELQSLLDTEPKLRMAISRLAQLECRVGPLCNQDTHVLAAYEAFFARPDLAIVELDAKVVDLATLIRVQHRLRTPDALQAACCLQLGAEHAFLTGDKTFRRVSGLKVHVIG